MTSMLDYLRPSCRFCGYSLRGFRRNACPECGRSLLGQQSEKYRLAATLMPGLFWPLACCGPAAVTLSSLLVDRRDFGYPASAIGLCLVFTGVVLCPILSGLLLFRRLRSK